MTYPMSRFKAWEAASGSSGSLPRQAWVSLPRSLEWSSGLGIGTITATIPTSEAPRREPLGTVSAHGAENSVLIDPRSCSTLFHISQSSGAFRSPLTTQPPLRVSLTARGRYAKATEDRSFYRGGRCTVRPLTRREVNQGFCERTTGDGRVAGPYVPRAPRPRIVGGIQEARSEADATPDDEDE